MGYQIRPYQQLTLNVNEVNTLNKGRKQNPTLCFLKKGPLNAEIQKA